MACSSRRISAKRLGVAQRAGTETELRERLALNVRKLRESAGLTLEQAAERSGMYWRHWQKVEAGEVNATLKTLVRLGLALDVDPGELVAAPKRAERSTASRNPP